MNNTNWETTKAGTVSCVSLLILYTIANYNEIQYSDVTDMKSNKLYWSAILANKNNKLDILV